MSTKIRDEISTKNKYYIPRERYLELKWFCRQYDSWKKELLNFDYAQLQKAPVEKKEIKRLPNQSSIVENAIVRKSLLEKKIKLVEDICMETDPEIYGYLLIGVTKDVNYEYLNLKEGMPVSRSTYYDRYRKFFYILDKRH